MNKLPPWLQRQWSRLRSQTSHALLLTGPHGLGQYSLALSLVQTWLCEQPHDDGPCGVCASCHAIEVRTHPDLCVLMPEVLALEQGWPLDPKIQEKIDRKELKPSKQIRVEATRAAIAYTQLTASRGGTRVVWVYPAERLNIESANTLLKTLEEPPGAVRFVLATEAVQGLLPTLRSRCVTHALSWPEPGEALAWLGQACPGHSPSERAAALRATGGRPELAEAWLQSGFSAQGWSALPQQLALGQAEAMASWPVARQMDALLKLCHDLMVARAGGQPRFFALEDLPTPPEMARLNDWRRDLLAEARTMEHPFQAGLMLEAWALRARQALALHSNA
jgi:DNA polymerase III subunit delta'